MLVSVKIKNFEFSKLSWHNLSKDVVMGACTPSEFMISFFHFIKFLIIRFYFLHPPSRLLKNEVAISIYLFIPLLRPRLLLHIFIKQFKQSQKLLNAKIGNPSPAKGLPIDGGLHLRK